MTTGMNASSRTTNENLQNPIGKRPHKSRVAAAHSGRMLLQIDYQKRREF
jgi:hypothetical protein